MPHPLTLGPSHHLRRICNIPNSKAPTHKALLRDRHGREFRAVVKIFPPGSHGLIGEQHGWTYHRAAGLPCAPNAAIILIPMQKLRHYHPECEWLAEMEDDHWSGWAVEIPSTTGQPFPKSKQIQALCNDRHILDLILLREALHDIDAHINNFIPADGGMMAVDFAESFGGQKFGLANLPALRWLTNKLSIEVLADPPEKTRNQLQEKGNMLHAVWIENEPYLRMWRDRLIHKEIDRKALADFLHQRMNRTWSTKRWA